MEKPGALAQDGGVPRQVEPTHRSLATMSKPISLLALVLTCLVFLRPCGSARGEVVGVRPVLLSADGGSRIEYRSGEVLVGRSTEAAPAGVALKRPGGDWAPIRFQTGIERDGILELGPEKVGGLTFRWRLVQRTPSLVERTLEVQADTAGQFTVAFPLEVVAGGEYASFTGPVTERVVCDTVRGAAKTETFPVGMVRSSGKVIGIVADSPGLWENRCQVVLDPAARRLEVWTGDGRAPYPLVIQPPEDARDTYQYEMDGWQTVAAGETRRFTTWVFGSPARHHYDAQVGAHLAVANAKGWNGSLVEAILRNTSLYLLRRNLARDAGNQPRDGRYIFVSGPGYGWKQWVSDGFYTALGLDDPEKTIEANRAVFWTRMDYEDNAQYYLIWAALMKRAGGTVNDGLVRQAYRFIRHHEKEGLYIPPSLPGAPNAKGWKTYHDVLPYDEGDAPASNQGFHCGALLAAKELGLDVTDQEIATAISAYQSLFNRERGFMPTSRMQSNTLGQDTLYGATLTYAVFGTRVLTDEQVLTHVRTSEKVKTPYGLRVISQADGSLLPGHSGVYCYGGSWFLNDAANYLLAGVHGWPTEQVDALLVERVARELAFTPAFNESISTVNGRPHGHILYSWNSGYWWLRKEVRRRLGQTSEDPVERAVDARLGVVRDGGFLRLDPEVPTVAPPTVQGADPVRLETPRFRYVLSGTARNLEFTDRASGLNYLAPGDPAPCATVRRQGKEYPATRAVKLGDRLTLTFEEAEVDVRLKVESRPDALVLTLESVVGEVESIRFLDLPLTLAGKPGDAFAACALSLNLFTRVDALPVLQQVLRASAERKFGLVGAKVAIVAAPMDRMLPALQATLAGASELPVCRVAGPWAHAVPFNHGSYLFNFGALTETNVTDWIETTRRVGFTQIDNHGGGGFFRFGDFELNRKKWPDGWESYRRIVDTLHQAGIGSIFHTYAFFIDKASKYVAPVPDPRLDAFRTFTLSEPLTAEATELTVNESTAGMTTITGFFEHNSVVLHLGDELVTFDGVSQSAPWRFTGLKRGALGTRASGHARGAAARHLKECFGLFVPNVETTLFEEIAANHADIVNRCGFDGIYLDAIDGSSILRGGDEVWYWGNKFVVEIQKRLKRPVGMEMSAMWHHFWQYRTRWQAWDLPQRGHKRFVDLHAAEVNGGLMLPLHLGWWGFQTFQPPQIEPSYPDVMETLGARLIGWDAGISLTAGVDREALRKTPLFRRAAEILRTCEELRHAKVFDDAARARLRDPGQEFALFKTVDGTFRFRPSQAHSRNTAQDEPWTADWTLTNGFPEQPARFRIEALMAAAPADGGHTIPLADLAREPREAWQQTTALGVGLTVSPAGDVAEDWAMLRATNAGKVPRNAAWARLEKRFDPPLAAKEAKALSVEIEGDGSGALLAIRLESPRHIAYGAIADRYVTLDFVGRRRFTLVETESARWSDYVWNDGKHPYNAYRETIDFGALEKVSVWLQNLPQDRETRVRVGPIRAVPLKGVALTNPRFSLNGQSLEFPVALAPGSWIEGDGPDTCVAYDAKGESLGKVIPRGSWPILRAGGNAAAFAADATGEWPARARVTVFGQGDAF